MQCFQIDIPKRGHACHGQGELFVPGMDYYSFFYNDPEKGTQRHDYCLQCWQNFPEYEQAAAGKVTWRSRVAAGKETPFGPTVRDQRIHALFHHSSEQDPAERFILAIYLQRKKRLFLRSEYKDESGQVILLYEIPETEEMLPIHKVPLSSIHVQKIQTHLAEKLKVSCA